MTVKTVPSLLRFGAGVVLRGTLVGLVCSIIVPLISMLVRYTSWAEYGEEAGLVFAVLVISSVVGMILGVVLSVVAFLAHHILRATQLSKRVQNIVLYLTVIAATAAAWPILQILVSVDTQYINLELLIVMIPAATVGTFVVRRYMNRQDNKAGNVATPPRKPDHPRQVPPCSTAS